jgi:hypothetical protein
MRGSYSGKYARVPLSLHGFESRTSLHIDRFCSSTGRARDSYSRDWRFKSSQKLQRSRQALVAQLMKALPR